MSSEGVNNKSENLVVPTTTTTTATATTNSTGNSTEDTGDLLGSTLDDCDDETSLKSPSSTPLPVHKSPKTVRKHRKHGTTGRNFHIIDGKKIRSALTHKIWPPRGRRVNFPTNDNELVTGYLEPANPWEYAENVNVEGLIAAYRASCERHAVEPLENLIAQLEKLHISNDERCEELNLKDECLDQYHCEPLEELLKRVQFEKIDVESSSLDDESATILFEMLEYYQSARHLNMSSNRNIGSRGWQSCAQMIKKTTCLEVLEARDIKLTQQHMNILKRPLQLVSHLHVLKLENCGLCGPAFVTLVAALKMNTGLKELYLADNNLEQEDGIQLGALLRVNNHLQLLDISNNHIRDEGIRDLLEGLVAQTGDRRTGKGLSILVLWNNDLTRASSPHFSDAIVYSITLETLNIGKNPVGNELLELAQEALIKTPTLLQLGMQSTNLTCKGALLLANIVERNQSLQRIDLRDNNVQMEGLAALSFAMKRNSSVTRLDLDEEPSWSKTPATMTQYLDLVQEIKGHCERNEEEAKVDSSTDEITGSSGDKSRLTSVNSRKISLTCHTLPRSASVAIGTTSTSGASDPAMMAGGVGPRAMLEPKRTSGGRLRSPAPSPIPSPVASPIPSPSRGRFVVSRVCETSLSSTNSSASSSPVTPPSLTSSPSPCFFPNNVGGVGVASTSRFRVTIVDAKPEIVTPIASSVTIGFDYKVHGVEDSDDSDSVFRSPEIFSRNDSSPSIDISLEDDDNTSASTGTTATIVKREEIIETIGGIITFDGDKREDKNEVPAVIEDIALEVKEDIPKSDNSSIYNNNISNHSTRNNINDSRGEGTTEEEFPVSREQDIIETKGNSSPASSWSSPLPTKEFSASKDSEKSRCGTAEIRPESVRQTTSLERLLGLFQHPGSLFATTTTTTSAGTFVEKTDSKNPIQDSVNSMIALGDKFQQYLRDGRAKIVDESTACHRSTTLKRSVSDTTRSTCIEDHTKIACVLEESSMIRDNPDEIMGKETKLGDFAENSLSTNVGDNHTREDCKTEQEEVSGARENTKLPEYTLNPCEERNPEELLLVDKIATDGETAGNSQSSEGSTIEAKFIQHPECTGNREERSIDGLSAVDKPSKDAEIAEKNGSMGNTLRKLADSSEYSADPDEIVIEKLSSVDKTALEQRANAGAIVEMTKASNKLTDIPEHPLGEDEETIEALSSGRQTSKVPETVNNSGFIVESSGNSNLEPTEIGNRGIVERSSSDVREEDENDKDDDDAQPENDDNSDEIIKCDRSSSSTRTDSINDSCKNTSVCKLTCDISGMIDVHTLRNDVHNFFKSSIGYEENTKGEIDGEEETTNHASSNPGDGDFCDSQVEEENNSINRSNTDRQDSVDSHVLGLQDLDVKTDCEEEKSRGETFFIGVPTTTDRADSTETIEEFFPVSLVESAIKINGQEHEKQTIHEPNREKINDDINAIIADIITDVRTSIDQISSSLSEDSGYSSKLLIDDVIIADDNENVSSIENSPGIEATGCGNDENRKFVNCETILTSFFHDKAESTMKISESSDDLMFKITDIMTDSTTTRVNRVISSIVVNNDDRQSEEIDNYCPQSSSGMNLSIDRSSRSSHRNSQDSGIEETTVSSSDDSALDIVQQRNENFQESVDSGIEYRESMFDQMEYTSASAQECRTREPPGKMMDDRSGVERFSTQNIDISNESPRSKEETIFSNDNSRDIAGSHE